LTGFRGDSSVQVRDPPGQSLAAFRYPDRRILQSGTIAKILPVCQAGSRPLFLTQPVGPPRPVPSRVARPNIPFPEYWRRVATTPHGGQCPQHDGARPDACPFAVFQQATSVLSPAIQRNTPDTPRRRLACPEVRRTGITTSPNLVKRVATQHFHDCFPLPRATTKGATRCGDRRRQRCSKTRAMGHPKTSAGFYHPTARTSSPATRST
jgi:hypothetical protein